METSVVIKEVSERLGIPEYDLVREGFLSYLRERKRLLMAERFEILSRHRVRSAEELRARIESGEVAEHPTWEEYIELTNLDSELAQLEKYCQ